MRLRWPYTRFDYSSQKSGQKHNGRNTHCHRGYVTTATVHLPPAQLIQTDPIKEKLKANTQAAADHGAFGIPTFFVGDDMFFGKDRLAQVEEALTK